MPYKNLPESEWGKMDNCVKQVMEKQPDLEKPNAIAICYSTITGKEYSADPGVEKVGNQYRVFDANSGATYKQVDSACEAVTLLDKVKASYDWDQCIKDQTEEYGDEETAKKVCGSIRAKFGEYKALSDKERSDIESVLKLKRKEGVIDRVLAWVKEGRRNSNTDASRLQQIHDLSVENGAQCPMVMKQANGSYRWILLSSNSYQDRDGEIVSQKAQEADVERLNQSGNFGPLRLWHLGYPDVAAKEAGPGVDVGVCDYSQMLGRIRVESGTFTDNRVGAAIKARSDQWAGSIGFFHPLDQPDRDGVYQDSFTFERSLLPRAYASNPLTPLAAILKEQEMTTKEEKLKQLSDLLGDSALANTVLKQAEATEKAAQERGLAYKATDAAPATEAPKKEDAPVEGSAAEEAQEPKAEAQAEGDTTDYEAMAKGLQPFIEKMIETKMAGAAKERTDKEASIAAQITAIDTVLKDTRKIVDVLNSDLPKGVKKFLASEADSTVTNDPKYAQIKEAQEKQPLNEIFTWLAQPMAAMPPAVQTSPEK